MLSLSVLVSVPAVSHITCRRYVRVGEAVAMEAVVTLPVLSLPPEGGTPAEVSAVERFNQAYRTMAEAFLTHCGESRAEGAVAAFAAAGPRAVYTFDRRMYICRMEAEVSSETLLVVRRTVMRTSKRDMAAGVPPMAIVESTDRWRCGDLTLLPPMPQKGRARSAAKTSAFS